MFFQRMIEHMPESVLVTDTQGTIKFVNPAFTRVTGYSFQEIVGQNPKILQSGRQDTRFYQDMWETIAKDNHWQGEIWNRRKNGEVYPEWLSISAVRNDQNKITNYIGVFTDITLRKISENTLQYLAYHDSLTRLPNRTLFFDRLTQALAQADRSKDLIAVLYVDLDHFKLINDTLGHEAGDSLLKMVSLRLQKCIRKGDTLARIGGDEFVIVLVNVIDFDNTKIIATKILETLSKPFRLRSKQDSYVTASIGISMYPFDGQKAEQLLTVSDRAMYKAKKIGMNCYSFDKHDLPFPTTIHESKKQRGKLPVL